MNNIILILIVITVNGIWTQTQAKSQMDKNSKVSCLNNNHCIAFNGVGATCKNNTCICENEEPCKPHRPDARVKSNVIGEDCVEDYNCNIQFSVCSETYCACIPERVASNDGRKCLEVSGGLGQECEQDIQCIRKISGSVCRESKCVCDDFHHEDSSGCFEKVGLGQTCKYQSQCNHIFHAHCGSLFCECDSGFVESDSRTKCLPEATKLLDMCEESQQCRQFHVRGAVCMYGRCDCDVLHRVANISDCPTRLKQPCANHDECKSYKDDLTMHCESSRCECKPPYFEQDGYCSGSSIMNCAVTSILVLLSIMFNVILHFQ